MSLLFEDRVHVPACEELQRELQEVVHLGDGGRGGFSGEQSKDDLDFQW